MWSKRFVQVTCTLMALLFTYTAMAKLSGLQEFEAVLAKSPFVTQYALIISWGLPIVELIVAGMLLFSLTRRAALYLSLFLMAAFSAYIVAMLTLSYSLPCSCGGILSSMSWQQHLVFNLCCTLACAISIYLMESGPTLAASFRSLTPLLLFVSVSTIASSTSPFPDWYQDPYATVIADNAYRTSYCGFEVPPTCAYYLSAPNVVEDKMMFRN